jgi:spore coat protein H
MIKILKLTLITFGALLLLFTSLQSLSAESSFGKSARAPTQVPPSPTPLPFEKVPNIDDLPLRDNPDVYKYDDPGSIVTMYVTVRKGNVSDNTDYTWKEVNAFTKWFYTNNTVVTVGKADAILQVGDENGPLPGEVGYGEVVPNATIQIRGASSSMLSQKSYKIELDQGAGTWRGQSSIALNKHEWDPSRVRNKLNFDLMKQIPDMVSLRTQFVHLYVKDQTTDPWGKTFVDYGLFTQVELPDQRFLKAHLLDPNGQLYKTTFFEFNRYPDQIRLVDDPLFDENTFSSKLEIKGNRDNSKLIQMLDDLNNPGIPIETTFQKYFDADNYFTWMAYNILVSNVDTSSQNFYLYSPQNGNKFYFIPWDYDDSFFRQDRASCCGYSQYYSYEYGIANYWGSRLANRVLRVAAYRQMLDVKINELMDLYKPVAEKYALQMPDLKFFPTNKKQGMEKDYENIPTEVRNNYNLYLETLKTSMPFYLGTPIMAGGSLKFEWDESYDFINEDITYRFMVAKDQLFKQVLVDETLINSTQIDPLKPGEYFWRVIATNSLGKTQLPFDSMFDSKGTVSGLKRFSISPNGEVQE